MWQFAVDIRETKNISKNFIPEMAMRWYSGPNSTAEASKIRKSIMGSARLLCVSDVQVHVHCGSNKLESTSEGTNDTPIICPLSSLV